MTNPTTETIIMPTEHMAFPTSRTEQIDATKAAQEPYRSPHLAKIIEAQGGLYREGEAPAQPPVVRAVAGPQNAQAQARRAATNMTSNLDSRLPAPVYAASVTPEPVPEAPVPTQITRPGFTSPSDDDEAVVLALPSRYAFYDFKDVYVKPFKGRSLAKLSRAKTEGSMLLMVEAVSAVLSNTRGDKFIAFRLTLPDFYYVLHWLRRNSFTKVAYVHTFACTNPAHIEDVSNGVKLKDTLKNSVTIKQATLKESELEVLPEVPELSNPDLYLTACTMQDVLELTESPMIEEDEDSAFYGGLAVFLRSKTRDLSFEERVSIVADMNADDIYAIQGYDKAVAKYGIEEVIRVRCASCSAIHSTKVDLQPHDFFH